MQDILKVVTGYLIEKINSLDPPYTIKIPRDLLEYLTDFYFKAYLNNPTLNIEGGKLVIEGVNFIKIRAELSFEPGAWNEEHREILVKMKLNKVLMPFIKSFITPFEAKTEGIVRYREGLVIIDIESAIKKSQIIDSCTKPLRKSVRLSDIKITESGIEFVFTKT